MIKLYVISIFDLHIQWQHLQKQLMNLPQITQYINKSVNKDNWRKALTLLSSEQKTKLEQFLIQYEEGLDIGLPNATPLAHSNSNPKMSLKDKCKMAETILKWHKKGYLMGPYSQSHPIANECRINPVFCVPKPDGSVRPVVNYSKEINGYSLNDLLYPEWCTVEYIQLREIVYTIKQMGEGAMMWVKDLEDGYFNIKIRPDQTKAISFIFAGMLYIPMVLVFGLATAPLIFTMFMWFAVMAIRYSDVNLMWHSLPNSQFNREVFQTDADLFTMNNNTYFPLVMYYLDDIFGVHRPHLVYKQYELAGTTLKQLGLSAKETKDKPPNTTQIILGLEYDTLKMEVRIPTDKIDRYIKFAISLMKHSQITKRQLFSLTGKVRFAAIACKALSSFARGVELHGHHVKHWHHHINMSRRLKKDINLIIKGLLINKGRGKTFDFILKPRKCFDLTAFTDATSKEGGIGGFIDTNYAPFFQVNWSEVSDTSNRDIQWRELAAIAVLLMCYKNVFSGKCVNIWCDNEPVVWMLIKWRANLQRTDLQNLLRLVAEICIENNIVPWWDHIPGEENTIADNLSRFKPYPFSNKVQPNKFFNNKIKPASKPTFLARKHLQTCINL